jgi:uncharacterized protein (TIRG00374 family)
VRRTASQNEPSNPPTEVEARAEERAVNLGSRFFNLRTGLSFLLGIAILVALFRFADVNAQDLLAQIRGVDLRLYALAILSYVLTFPFRGIRWQRLLRNAGVRLPVLPLTEVIFISWFVNSVLPGKIGDLYRGYMVKREHGVSLSRTVGTVVAERVVDLLCLILLLGVTGLLVLRNRVSPVVDGMLHLGWIGFAVLIVGMFVAYRFGERLVSFFPRRVQEIYRRFAQGTFSSFTLKSAPLLVLLTVLAWSAEAARLFFVVSALNVPGIGPLAALFTVAAISLSLILPTPGGLGGVEAAFVLVLAVFGVDKSLAIAVALLDRIISYYSLIVFGFPAFLLTKRGR